MNTSIEKSEEERKKCTCSLKGGGQGGGQALVGEGRMAAGQGPAAAAGGKAGPAAGKGPAPSMAAQRDRRCLEVVATTGRRPDGGGPVEARVVVPPGAAGRGVSAP